MPLHKNNLLVELSDVSLSYGMTQVLHHVDMEVRCNDFITITGPNGGGKTSLLRVLLKLLRPTHGAVRYWDDGDVVETLKMGYLPQKSAIDNRFPITVREVIESGLIGAGCSKQECKHRVKMMLDELQLDAVSAHSIAKLSGGQMQRMLLGRALISNPQLIILDEPFSYLDESFGRSACSLLAQHAERSAVVVVTHRPALVENLTTRSLKIVDGIVVE